MFEKFIKVSNNEFAINPPYCVSLLAYTWQCSLCPQNKVIPKDNYKGYMKKIKPKNYSKAENLKCDWNDKRIV